MRMANTSDTRLECESAAVHSALPRDCGPSLPGPVPRQRQSDFLLSRTASLQCSHSLSPSPMPQLQHPDIGQRHRDADPLTASLSESRGGGRAGSGSAAAFSLADRMVSPLRLLAGPRIDSLHARSPPEPQHAAPAPCHAGRTFVDSQPFTASHQPSEAAEERQRNRSTAAPFI